MVRLALLSSAILAVSGQICSDDFGCSLAGECVKGQCVCDGWSHGEHCERLNLLPVDTVRYGYRNSSGYNSWGGGPVKSNDGTWHLFASQMHGKCSLSGHWSKASEAIHSVSDHPMGPFKAAETVIPSFAHNVKPFQAPDGTFLIFYVGSVNNDTGICSNASALRLSDDPDYVAPKEAAGPVMIASAKSPDAPAEEWQHHGPMTDSFEWHSATNPVPVFFPNGSVLLYVSRRWSLSPTDKTKNEKNNWIMMADSWQGPYRNVTQSYSEALKTGEDPHVFRTKRGFHQLNHNTGPSSTTMSFSADGLNWTKGNFGDAFNATLQWSNGSETTLCRRQRPFIVMADDGMPGWLWNGVMDGPGERHSIECTYNPTWTLVQQIGRTPSAISV